MADDIPDTGAVFTFGKSRFADNEPSHFFIKNDPIVAISCGDEHSAVICQNGRVFVFGGNAWGQLGLGHKDEVTRPSCVKWLKPHRAVFVACGRAHTVFVTDSNAIYTVGCNSEGQLGTGDVEPQVVPQYVELQEEQPVVKQVSAGANHTAILTEDGRVFVCGSNAEGQLGQGEDTKCCLRFTELHFVEKIAFVECGYYHTVFITTEGAVFVTGDNENQKLGIPHTTTTIFTPEVLPINISVKSACCGASHTFLLSMDENTILAFGSNEMGQLGMPKEVTNVTEPTEIDMEKMFDGFQLKLVACGAAHTAFVTDNGLLYTCGESRHNKLCLEEIEDADNSNEALSNQYMPKRVTAMNGYIVDNAACGGCHTLLTATRGSNADFTNNDFNIVNTENRQISVTELPPLQKLPGMNKNDDRPYTAEDVHNSNTTEQLNADNVNGNLNEDSGSINSLEANVSGSHIVNINDLENDNASLHDIPAINSYEIHPPTVLDKNGIINVVESLNTMAKSTEDQIDKTAKEVLNDIDTITNTASDEIKANVHNTIERVKSIEDMAKNTTDDIKNTIKDNITDISDKANEKIEVVEEFVKKTASLDPIFHGEKKALEIPDKAAEISNSPPPKSPIIQDLLQLPDLSHISPNLSKQSDDGQSENETIPCGSDKSSPQAGKTAKTQAVMPIVRSEDNIDSHEDTVHNEEADVVVNKNAEKGRFARIFQSLKDKENSCMSKGKVIEENIADNVHKGIDHAEEAIGKIEETVETQIRNHTNSRTCTIL